MVIGVDRHGMPSYNWSAFRSANLWQIRQNPDMTETKRNLPSLPTAEIPTRFVAGVCDPGTIAGLTEVSYRDCLLSGLTEAGYSILRSAFGLLLSSCFLFSVHRGQAQSPDVPLVPREGTSAASAAPEISAAPVVTPEADKLMQTAAKVVCEYQTIEAKIRQRVELLETQLVGSGAYAQQQTRDGSQLLLRLELKILAPDQRVLSYQQVCDGPDLWTYQEQVDRAQLTRVDMERVRKAWQTKQSFSAPTGLGQLGLGGIPRIVKGLDHSFQFTEASSATLDERPVYRLRGGWEPHRLLALLPDQQAAIAAGQGINLQKLPKHVPWLVEIDLGQDDYFPYRITYLRPPAGSEKKLAKADFATLTAAVQPICQIEFYEVKLNSPINTQLFVYNQTTNLEIVDTTDKLLRTLQLSEGK